MTRRRKVPIPSFHTSTHAKSSAEGSGSSTGKRVTNTSVDASLLPGGGSRSTHLSSSPSSSSQKRDYAESSMIRTKDNSQSSSSSSSSEPSIKRKKTTDGSDKDKNKDKNETALQTKVRTNSTAQSTHDDAQTNPQRQQRQLQRPNNNHNSLAKYGDVNYLPSLLQIEAAIQLYLNRTKNIRSRRRRISRYGYNTRDPSRHAQRVQEGIIIANGERCDNGGNDGKEDGKVLSLGNFLHLIAKTTGDSIGYNSSGVGGGGGGSSNNTSQMIETLAVVYMTVAHPSLISMNGFHNDHHDGDDTSAPLSQSHSHSQSPTITVIHVQENRMERLTTLYQTRWEQPEQQLSSSLYQTSRQSCIQTISDQIIHWKRQKHQRKGLLNMGKSTGIGGGKETRMGIGTDLLVKDEEARITPGMTIEERVRARAKYSQEQKKKRRIVTSSSNNSAEGVDEDEDKNGNWKKNGRKEGSSGSSKNDHHCHNYVVFADALRSYLRHAYNCSFRLPRIRNFAKTKDALGANAVKSKTRHLLGHSDEKNIASKGSDSGSTEIKGIKEQQIGFKPMPMEDVCNHLAGVQGANSNRAVKYSKREVREIILELVEVVPEWIQIIYSCTRTGAGETKKIKKRGIVLIKEQIPYRNIREKLGGRTIMVSNAKDIAKVADLKATTASLTDSSSPSTTEKRVTIKQGMTTKPKAPVTPGIVEKESSIERPKVKNGKRKLSLRRTTPTPIPKPSMPKYEKSGKLLHDMDTSNHDTIPYPNPSPRQKKEPHPRRVNHNQRLIDDDYDGGRVIYSTTTNPRGLKRMFSRLNAGERI